MSAQTQNRPVDPDGLMEFSVVFTDRSLNHMSKVFQGVMNDLHAMLCEVYKADHVALVPGGGTFGQPVRPGQPDDGGACGGRAWRPDRRVGGWRSMWRRT